MKSGTWDISFVAIDPGRGIDIDYTAPYVIIEGTYLVSSNAPFENTAEVDNEGVRVAVVKGSAYDLFLTRSLKNAQLVRMESFEECLDLLKKGEVAVVGGVRQPLVVAAKELSDVRVLPDRFMIIEQAMAMPKGRDAATSYLKSFVEDVKASGFVAQALQKSGQGDAVVAPPAPQR